MTRQLILTFALLANVSNAAETQPAPERETVSARPSIRSVPLTPMLRFEPKADMTAEELEQLKPYLSGKPVYEEDRKALGPAMRHLKELR
jgi:hypothetical protein